MKNTKKFAAMIAALTLSACSIAPMAMTASAADGDVTIDIMDGETKSTATFNAYKILDATASKADSTDLNATDAYNYTVNEKYESILMTALGNKYDTEKGIVDAISKLSAADMRAFADAVYNAILADNNIEADATSNEGSFEVGQGYYLIAQVAANDAATSLVMVDTADFEDESGSIKINVKKQTPSFDKEILDINDTTGDTSKDWGKDADHDMNDDVSFRLTATLPSDYSNYNKYTLKFHDDLQNEVFDANSVAITSVKVLDASDAEVATLPASQYNKDTGCGETHSKGTNGHGDGCDFVVNIPDLKAAETDTVKFDTGYKVVVEYTAKLTESANIGSAGNWNTGVLEYSNNPYSTDDGDNTTSKTEEEDVVAFTYKTVINKVNGQDKALAGAAFKLEKLGADGTTYTLVKEFTAGADTEFEFKGLDDGTYRLTETKTPDGYNGIEPVVFKVEATHADKELTELTGTATTGELTITKDATNEDALTAKVVNNSGSELPSTGGIGTTIFYLGGGAMVAVAGVFLITKKRMGKSEN